LNLHLHTPYTHFGNLYLVTSANYAEVLKKPKIFTKLKWNKLSVGWTLI